MDNFRFDITADRNMRECLAIAFSGAPGGKAVCYRVEEATKDDPPARGFGPPRPHGRRLILGWHENMKDSVPLASPVGLGDFAVELVLAWLSHEKPGHAAPDHDGDNGRGFRIYNEAWGHVGDDSYAFVAIEPEWAWYGK